MKYLNNHIFCILTFYFLCIHQVSAIQLAQEKEISLPPSFTPSGLCIDEFGYLYILDNNLQKVIKADEEGTVIDTLIRGKGRDIKRAKDLCDITYGNGKIIISDLALQRISIFDTSGNFVHSFLTSNELLPPSYIKTDGSSILIRTLKEEKERSDSANFSGWFLQKYDIKGNLSKSLIYQTLSQAVWYLNALPFEVDWKNKTLFVLMPLASLQIFDFNGKRIRKIRRDCWIHIENIKLLDKKYLLITSYSAGKIDTILPEDLEKNWKSIRTDKVIREVLKEEGILEIFNGTPKFAKTVNYILDIYDIKKNKFILTDYLPSGELLATHKNYIFFKKGKNITKVKIK